MLLKESDMNNFNFWVNMSLHFNIIFCFVRPIVFVFGFWFWFWFWFFLGGGCGGTDLITSFPALGPVERSRALQSPHAPCFVYVSAELIPF